MAVPTITSLSKLPLFSQPKRTQFSSQTAPSKFLLSLKQRSLLTVPSYSSSSQNLKNAVTILGVTGIALATLMVGPATATASELAIMGSSFQFNEPSNALSLPTWAIHVSSVVECIYITQRLKPIRRKSNISRCESIEVYLAIRKMVTAMALVWQYGEKSGNASWKGLSWGMVPLLGGAFCACTWHFFYNSESLEVLVALQAALTVLGNATMCVAAFRIYRSQEQSKEL
ncbi:PREDICTED: uncharacterized protein LOC109231321 isoform X1 [Nicotiana attenuata]|uniref:uncharacterized protein LOC109231321 isoform X1 n=1 Tax=Nicotiana attenuata TaxID=49451 RepID=UPI00090466CA|nr:PREDICTED: uncharacterized protein LOC109231321 isoform X1 [Nicotiana attenuata]